MKKLIKGVKAVARGAWLLFQMCLGITLAMCAGFAYGCGILANDWKEKKEKKNVV